MTRDLALPRYDWTLAEVESLFDLPFTELVYQAASVHRRCFDPAEVQRSQLLSVKTGGCAENCGYCSQSWPRPARRGTAGPSASAWARPGAT